MSRFDPVENVVVSIGECLCPGTPHEQDEVYLAPSLSAPAGMAAQMAIASASTDDGTVDLMRLEELLWRIYRDHGVVGWNLVNEDGPVPVTVANLEIGLPYSKGGRKVGDAADELYREDVLTPFRERAEAVKRQLAQQRSPRGTTSNGPKATSSTQRSTRKQQRRSSTPDTEPVPPAG